ncbi:MAG: extracellular solute-binding protein [Lachnospiraceae bacterium]|nr:extracellular solute-binding protein [Lachnospiraceae bacterium]
MKRKLLVTMLSVSLLSTMLVGCGNMVVNNQTDTEETDMETKQGEEDEQLESGKVSLRVWVEEANIENLQKMIDSFEQEYAGQAEFDITIEVSADADTRTNVLGDIHNAADIFSMPDDQLYSMIAGGALSPVVNQSEVKSANLPEAVDAASYNGTLYAYPYSADNGYFLYYNKAYLSDSDVQTMDRILEVAAENEKTLSMEFNSGWYLYSFFGNTGLEFGINDDGVTNYCNWNTTEGRIKGVDVTQALLDIATHPGFAAQPDGSFVEDMQAGNCIAGISGVWNAVAVQEAWGNNYAACKLPTYTCNGQQIQMSSFVGYKMFGVNAYSEHLAWAHKLADWITNEENQILRFEERSTGPSNIVAASSDVVAKVPAIAAVIDQSQFGVLQRVGNSYWTACTTYADTIAAGNPDNMPLQDMVDRLVSGITASVVQ